MKVSRFKLDMLLAQKDMSAKELSDRAEVTEAFISTFGKKNVSPKYVGRVARALNVAVTDLLEDTEM